jgi:hypothetical protein
MSDKITKPNTVPEKKQDVEIEPLSDQALEDVSGGALELCPLASCSANVCST